MRRLSKNEFIEKAKKIHGNKYDYSKVEYRNSKIKVIVICPVHGEFKQTPHNHLIGQGCPYCGGSVRRTTEDFIKQAKKIHGDRYDYSRVNYINNRTKIEIVCPIHGSFQQIPYVHLSGSGCLNCSGKKKLTTEEFIKKAKKIHGDKYNYSRVNYINNETKVEIICNKCKNIFQQTPNNHVSLKQNCPFCASNKKLSTSEFIKRAKYIHGDKYNYSRVNYINNRTKVEIICPKHGSFQQTPYRHTRAEGCPKCAGVAKLSTSEFIKRSKTIHENKYNYSRVNYINNRTKVEIICNKCKNSFWQIPDAHLRGVGCPKCANLVSKPEQEIVEQIENNITSNIIRNTRKIISPYELDIYLPKYKLAIEFNGTYWHSMNRKPFNYHQMKVDLCREKNIHLIHVFEEDYKKYKADIFEEIKCCCSSREGK